MAAAIAITSVLGVVVYAIVYAYERVHIARQAHRAATTRKQTRRT